MRIKKFLSAKCPVWSGICLSCGRRRRLYCCVAIDGGGSCPRRTWLELLLILLNNRSSCSSTSWTKSGRSGEQYPYRLLRWRNASMRWLSVPVINPIHADAAYVSRDTTIGLKTVWRADEQTDERKIGVIDEMSVLRWPRLRKILSNFYLSSSSSSSSSPTITQQAAAAAVQQGRPMAAWPCTASATATAIADWCQSPAALVYSAVSASSPARPGCWCWHKRKTSLDLNEAGDDGVWGWQWRQLDHMQTICTSIQTVNHINTSSVIFSGRMLFQTPIHQCQSIGGIHLITKW